MVVELTSLKRACCVVLRVTYAGGMHGERASVAGNRRPRSRGVTECCECAAGRSTTAIGRREVPPRRTRRLGGVPGGGERSPELSTVVSSRPLLRSRPRCDWVARPPADLFYTLPLLGGLRNIFLFCERPTGPGYRWPVTTNGILTQPILVKHYCLEIGRSSALDVLH